MKEMAVLVDKREDSKLFGNLLILCVCVSIHTHTHTHTQKGRMSQGLGPV